MNRVHNRPHLLAENGNRALESSLTRHYIMELEHELSSRTELKTCYLFTRMHRKLVTPDEVSNYLNQGAASVAGAEVFLRHRIPDKFSSVGFPMLTHTLNDRENPTATYQPYLFDNTHIV